ncbi:MAG: hypothetical protein WAN11_01215 [Syntrophobacteraceae bacterium]
MIQLEAFGPRVLKNAHLVVLNTPRKTFYSIRIEVDRETFRVLKVSGARGKVWDKRVWEFSTLDEAEALFTRRIREKTNPGRRSPRKYSIKHLLPEKTHDGTK